MQKRPGEIVSRPFNGHTGDVMFVMFSKDGKRILSGSFDNTICVWLNHFWTALRPHLLYHIYGNLTRWDTRHLGANDGTICIWNIETGALISGPLVGHTSFIASVAFSHDGTCIVSV